MASGWRGLELVAVHYETRPGAITPAWFPEDVRHFALLSGGIGTPAVRNPPMQLSRDVPVGRFYPRKCLPPDKADLLGLLRREF